ncbi:19087_t:CDS:1, partial [Racocetra persica]
MSNKAKCLLCGESFASRKKHSVHKRTKHRNNKIIPQRHLFPQPSLSQITYYQNAFIVLLKKRLGFSRHSVGNKKILINAFPENIFIFLFENEPTFRYNSAQKKYKCKFEGESGAQRLKQIFNYKYWDFRQDSLTQTKGYVLLADNEGTYEVIFTWTQSELEENDRIFQCGTFTCTFTTDAHEFSE